MSQVLPLTENETEFLKYSSRMTAKVDTSAVQDGYQLYHHNFILSENGNWAVVQQGMNEEKRYARRYHWLSEDVKSFVNEPHTAICCDHQGRTLNMVAKENKESRMVSVDIVKDSLGEVKKYLLMGRYHWIDKRVFSKFLDLKDFQPRDYEEILAFRGVGPKTIRALALTSKLIYGTELSWKDPVKFSFARGGKDGTPYPVDRKAYDEGSEILRNAIENAKLGNRERLGAIRRLESFI